MKTFKRLTTFVVSLLLIVAFSSCEKQSDDLQSISFNVQNVTNSLKKATGPKDIDTPVCKDDTPAYVLAEIDNVVFRLDILSGLNDGTETQVLKLDVGTYTLQSFKVYSNLDSLMWATPNKGSYYANLFGINGVDTTFTVEAFKKSKFDIDVLCWQAYSYKDFGFNWFDYTKVEIKTLCFFGDVCVDEDQADVWHLPGSESVYEGLPYEGPQFVALIEVFIKNSTGDTVNDLELNSSLESALVDNGDGTITINPLCIEFPDYLSQEDNYTFTINLIMPDGESEPIVVNEPFKAEDNWSDITGFDNGVYLLEVGCDGYDIPQGDPPPGCINGGGGFVYYGDVGNICSQMNLTSVGFTSDELTQFGSSLEELDNNNHNDPIRGHEFVRFDGWFGRVANPQGDPTRWGDNKEWTYPIFIHSPSISASDNIYDFGCLDQKILVGWATYSYYPSESTTGSMHITYEAVDGYVLSNICTYVNHTNISSKKFEEIVCSSGPEGTNVDALNIVVDIPSPRKPAQYLVAGYMNVCPE